MATVAISDDLEKVIAEKTPKKKVQFAGFAAGIASGWTKLIVGHPLDTLKTRVQASPPGMYKGAWDCLVKTVTKEGARKLYAGASAPAVGWSITDAILMGTLHNYRAFLLKHGFDERDPTKNDVEARRLSLLGHSVAGMWAGWSNAIPANVVEQVKIKLQLQHTMDAASADKKVRVTSLSKLARTANAGVQQARSYSVAAGLPDATPTRERFTGPIDVIRQTVRTQGVTGLGKGLGISFIYRTSFALFSRMFQQLKGTPYELSQNAANFLAGGLASNLYWLAALPSDNVKSRIMGDSLVKPRYSGIWHVVKTILHEKDLTSRSRLGNTAAGLKNFYRVRRSGSTASLVRSGLLNIGTAVAQGIVPVIIRAFPTNAAALAVWEAVMRNMNAKERGTSPCHD
ncbi:hypothetical protein QFC21_003347 [Naganishia friedmannii]|uniref:Uncharacterized protein n=1 Tax=Naganishia friedmannii TaxID=89922 RepID=A0ACC2VQ34_9TREE|nr:hypothetical protein QFC21_003347 [Naganishia friedmannii]